MRDRSVAFVVRDGKILMERLTYGGRTFYSIPGGGIEDGETPEQAAIRELKEECGLDGVIVKPLAIVYARDWKEYSFEVQVSKEQEAIKGYDPEEPVDQQAIKEVRWMSLREMSEKDRAFMWQYGLMGIDGFFDELLSWGDCISYPL
ncbi:MAG: NUDIX domain-containing protein [Lachnospiraceae bacterium]|nr:NUDIX domain-containing protein [Lachnospiraceae bacterium]